MKTPLTPEEVLAGLRPALDDLTAKQAVIAEAEERLRAARGAYDASFRQACKSGWVSAQLEMMGFRSPGAERPRRQVRRKSDAAPSIEDPVASTQVDAPSVENY